MAYQTDDLLAAVRRDSFMPISQTNFTDAEIFEIADGELTNTICPLLVSMDENWYLESQDYTYVANQANYTLPQYAMWLKLKRVERLNNGQFIPMLRIDINQLDTYNTAQSGTPFLFYLQHDIITVFPTPTSGLTENFRLYFYRRPNRMVLTSAAAEVLSVNKLTGVVTYTAAPPATYTANSFHDFFKGLSPFRRIITNSQATAQAGATQTFPVADVQDLDPGDWICLHDETVFPAIPIELQDFLKDLVIASLNRTQSDYENYKVQKEEIAERIRAAMLAPGQRVVSQGKKISIMPNGGLSPYWRGYRF